MGPVAVVGALVVVALSLGVTMRQTTTAAANGDSARDGSGIRTRATGASDEAWRAAHVTALPTMRLVFTLGWTGSVATVVVLVALLVADLSPWFGVVVPFACLVVQLGYWGYGRSVADRAARAVTDVS